MNVMKPVIKSVDDVFGRLHSVGQARQSVKQMKAAVAARMKDQATVLTKDRPNLLRRFPDISRQTIVVLLVAGGILCQGCASRMLYYPTDREYGRPSEAGYSYEEVTFPSRDGTRLSGWFVPAVGPPKGTVLHFHGNAQNMTAHFAFVSWLPREGFNVFVFDYRGYGKSEGRPGRKGVHEDSCAALAYLRSRPDIDPQRILILGQSLGGANALAAIQTEGADGIRAVALDSAFYSYRLIVRDTIKHIPVLGLLRWPLSFVVISNAKSPSATIGQLQPIPVLIFHGTDDGVVPFRHGRLLFERAREPRMLVAIPRGGHTVALVHQDPAFRKQLVDFYERACTELSFNGRQKGLKQ